MAEENGGAGAGAGAAAGQGGEGGGGAQGGAAQAGAAAGAGAGAAAGAAAAEKQEEEFNPLAEAEKKEQDEQARLEREEALKNEKEEDRRIREGVEKHTAPIMANLTLQQRTAELNTFLNSEEGKHFAPKADEIRKYLTAPQMQGLKVEAIAYAVAGKSLLKMGAKLGEEAAREAGATMHQGGAPARQEGGGGITTEQVATMPKDKFEDMSIAIKNGTYQGAPAQQ